MDGEDIQIRLQAKEGWAAAQGTGCVVVLSTELTDELIREGLARDMVRVDSGAAETRKLRLHRPDSRADLQPRGGTESGRG